MDKLITVPTAKLAKQLGFNLASAAYYSCDDPASGKPGNELVIKTWMKVDDVGRESSQEGTLVYEAPTQTALARWIREKFQILVTVDIDPDLYKGLLNYHPLVRDISVDREGLSIVLHRSNKWVFHTYEDAMELGLLFTLKYLVDRDGKPNESAKPEKTYKFVYRLCTVSSNRKFELGYIEEPTTNYRKEYPDSWADVRICEGFWGNENLVKRLVELMNANNFKP